jgi:OmpA-like transmembrane domain
MTGNHRAAALLAATLGLTLANAAAAETGGLYFGLTGGSTSFDMGGSKQDFDEAIGFPIANAFLLGGLDVLDYESSLDDTDMGYGLQVGYRFNRYVAAEVGYVNLGEGLYEANMTVTDGIEVAPVEVSARVVSSGPTAAVLGILPLGERFDVHAKAGLLFADTRFRSRVRDVAFDANVLHDESRSSEAETFVGVGGTWNINDSYSVRFEYQRYLDLGSDDTGEGAVDMVGLSVVFR